MLTPARRMQRSLLPALEPLFHGYRVAADYRPAFDVGGDFYDVVASGPGEITAVIGDVSGKCVSGAMVMSHLAGDIRRLARTASSPRALIEALNRTFASLQLDDMFVTCVCLRLEGPRRQITMCNAGHVLPLLRRASGAPIPLGVDAGLPLGINAEHGYRDEAYALEIGDLLISMTDGITEALHTDEDPLGGTALTRLIGASPRDGLEINRRILQLVEHTSQAQRRDDVTLLTLELTASACAAVPELRLVA
jgi:serine phosphatase RsbU (regulator of sigma subunit)